MFLATQKQPVSSDRRMQNGALTLPIVTTNHVPECDRPTMCLNDHSASPRIILDAFLRCNMTMR